MKKRWLVCLLTLTAALVFSLAAGLVCAAADDGSGKTWFGIRGDVSEWTATDSDTVLSSGTTVQENFLGKFFVAKDSNAFGDYEVEATLRLTQLCESSTQDIWMGIVPWAVDDNNWVAVCLKWANKNSTSLATVELNGALGGKDLVVYKDGFKQEFFNTVGLSGKNYLPTDAVRMKVSMQRGPYGDSYDIAAYLYEGDAWTQIGIWGVRDMIAKSSQKAAAGVHAYQAALEATGFKVTKLPSSNNYNFNDIAGTANVARGGQWTYADGTYTVVANSDYLTPDSVDIFPDGYNKARAILPNEYKDGNYAISADVSGLTPREGSSVQQIGMDV